MTETSSPKNNKMTDEGAFAFYGMMSLLSSVMIIFTTLNIIFPRSSLPELIQIASGIDPGWYKWILVACIGFTGFLVFTTLVFYREIHKPSVMVESQK